MRAGGSFSRGRGGAGTSRIGGNGGSSNYDFNTSQGHLQQGFQTSQGLPPYQVFQTAQGLPQQGFQTSQAGYSQGYTSEQLVDVRSKSAAVNGFERSRSGNGSSFSRGQGAQGGFGSSRQAGTEMGEMGGFQNRAMPATHSMGAQINSTGLNGMPGKQSFSGLLNITIQVEEII